MTKEEAIEYFKEHNESLVSVAKDENVYDYEKQVIESDCMRTVFEANEKAIKALEIELLTDTEQRIFLKAISREREVCQRVDDEYSDDDSKVSLVKVCNSIERKVKKIWE